MQTKVRFILVLACLLATSCGNSVNAPQIAVVASETPTFLPTPTKTFTPTNTPPPTETLASTETPVPKIDLTSSYVWQDSKPVLSAWNTAKPETTKGFDALPSVVDLEKQLGAPAWTPEFIRRWHAYLKQATIGGVPVAPQFDPDTVCNISWYTHNNENSAASFTVLPIKSGPACKTGTFPIAYVGGLTDNRPVFQNPDGSRFSAPLAAFTFAIWNPRTKQTELRTFGYSQHVEPATDSFVSLSRQGVYYVPNYNIELFRKEGFFSNLFDWFDQLSAKNGITIYDDDAVNAALERDGIYADGLDETILFGGRGAQPIDYSTP